MRHFFLTLAASVLTVGGLAGFTSQASAHDPSHEVYHDNLDHREFHRSLDHRDAHRYPMTWGQHEQLHDQLDHERYHDRLEHRQFHRDTYSLYQGYGNGGSYYGGQGFGFQGRQFSLYFGR